MLWAGNPHYKTHFYASLANPHKNMKGTVVWWLRHQAMNWDTQACLRSKDLGPFTFSQP